MINFLGSYTKSNENAQNSNTYHTTILAIRRQASLKSVTAYVFQVVTSYSHAAKRIHLLHLYDCCDLHPEDSDYPLHKNRPTLSVAWKPQTSAYA